MKSGGKVGGENISQRRERHRWEDVPKKLRAYIYKYEYR
jgi:hypothetical protein